MPDVYVAGHQHAAIQTEEAEGKWRERRAREVRYDIPTPTVSVLLTCSLLPQLFDGPHVVASAGQQRAGCIIGISIWVLMVVVKRTAVKDRPPSQPC